MRWVTPVPWAISLCVRVLDRYDRMSASALLYLRLPSRRPLQSCSVFTNESSSAVLVDPFVEGDRCIVSRHGEGGLDQRRRRRPDTRRRCRRSRSSAPTSARTVEKRAAPTLNAPLTRSGGTLSGQQRDRRDQVGYFEVRYRFWPEPMIGMRWPDCTQSYKIWKTPRLAGADKRLGPDDGDDRRLSLPKAVAQSLGLDLTLAIRADLMPTSGSVSSSGCFSGTP